MMAEPAQTRDPQGSVTLEPARSSELGREELDLDGKHVALFDCLPAYKFEPFCDGL